MDYWELRKEVSKIIPRMVPLFNEKIKVDAVREKGRKKNYKQYNLIEKEWRKQERLLNTEEINSFMEISVRASACPMPFNMDIWDGLICPFACIYCYANAFRASLYTAFFDNSKTMGFRHCNSDYYKKEIDKMEPLRGSDPHKLSGIRKAYALEIPVRMGIRFEDFLRQERRKKVSLEMLQYLKEISYPVMINTKSHLVGEAEYVRALSENKSGGAVHMTMLTPDERLNKLLEPGAPTYKQRLEACKNLTSAGVRVVARIEPYLFLINDKEEDVYQYIEDIKEAGIWNITFDTYSYTALNPGIRQSFINAGFDFDRLYLAGCDSQQLGSLLLKKYMELYRNEGISCSTFDLGNVPSNDQHVCCEVGDWFENTGSFNWGCTVMAAQFIKSKSPKSVTWKMFEKWVNKKGGFLEEGLKEEVHRLWNMEGNKAYSHRWAQGMTPVGWDRSGIIWKYTEQDERLNLLENII